MPNLRSAKAAPIGLLVGSALALIIYFTQSNAIQPIVYFTYIGLIEGHQLYELAWIMATIDFLLNFTLIFSLILWFGITIVISLIFRNMSATLSILTVAILLPAGTWLLFAIKYLYLPGFSLALLISFFLWQTLMPLGIILGFAALLSLPFILLHRKQLHQEKVPTAIRFACSMCGAEYWSKPVICVECGEEDTINNRNND